MSTSELQPQARAVVARPTLRGHIEIARIDHWFKNVFVLPGIIAAIGVDRFHVAPNIGQRIGLGLASVCLVASSNYVINEVLDAPSDRAHPVKFARPVPSGMVSIPLGVRAVARAHGGRRLARATRCRCDSR